MNDELILLPVSKLTELVKTAAAEGAELAFKKRDTVTLISAKDAAAQIGVTIQTIYNFRKQGKITGLVVGGSLRFRPEEIESFLKKQNPAQ
jgi:excisionase family DNA binding protein